MLKRLLIIVALCVASPALADADRLRDVVVRELRDDGYTEIRISRTWLGRMRFVANRPGARREIVVNPNTGAILRDYVRFWGDDDDESSIGSGSGSGPGGGQEDDDDDDDDEDDDEDDDDEDDDEDDEDNSGSGSSGDDDKSDDDESDNSGPGNSNDD